MLPIVDPVYSVAKGVFTPWLRWGLRWTVEGAEHIPTTGPALLASNHVSYLDPLTLAWVADGRGRHVRFLAKAELFDKPGLGTLLHAAHQIPVQRGRVDAADALHAAVEALGRGECVAVFPEGTISQDLEPMAGKSGTARLARQAGVAVIPVGLWGTHRILTKGRKPHWQWGVAQTAVVGAPITPQPDEHVKHLTDRVMAAIVECVARARELYPRARRRRGRVVVARSRVGGRAPEKRVTRVAVVGAGSWGTAVAAIVADNAPTMLWARRRVARREHRGRAREPRLPPAHPSARFAARHRRSRGGVRRRRRRRLRGAVARIARGARRRRGRTSRRTPRSSASPRGSSREPSGA